MEKTDCPDHLTIEKGDNEEILEHRAAEWEIPKAVLRKIFHILQQSQTEPECTDSALCELVMQYRELETELENYRSDDADIAALQRLAGMSLESGEFERTEEILNEAVRGSLEAAKQSKNNKHIYLLSAAAAAAENGILKKLQLDYQEAANYFRKASKLVPADHSLIFAEYLKKWGEAAYDSGDYANAASPLERALEIKKKILGKDDVQVADCLNMLAMLYNDLGKCRDAERMLRHALRILKKNLGPDHPNVAATLNNLALLYGGQCKYKEADVLFEQSIEIMEKNSRPEFV
jgi:tetratricopeptide (TPR) repeat protein